MYLAIFETDENSGFSVYFPDVPGCVSCDETFERALHMAKEALSLHVYGMKQDGEPLPERTDKVPETSAGDVVVPVSIYPDMVKEQLDNRREKTTVTIPPGLKEAATAEELNYSRLLRSKKP
jgi:predicted RNase H-like HicB family nuclease